MICFRGKDQSSLTSQPSPHYVRDAVARSWRWSCHWATIPRYRGTGPEAYLFSTSQGPRPEDARLPARRASSSERRMARSAVAAGGSCIMRVTSFLTTVTMPGMSRSTSTRQTLPLVIYPARRTANCVPTPHYARTTRCDRCRVGTAHQKRSYPVAAASWPRLGGSWQGDLPRRRRTSLQRRIVAA